MRRDYFEIVNSVSKMSLGCSLGDSKEVVSGLKDGSLPGGMQKSHEQ